MVAQSRSPRRRREAGEGSWKRKAEKSPTNTVHNKKVHGHFKVMSGKGWIEIELDSDEDDEVIHRKNFRSMQLRGRTTRTGERSG